MKNSQITKIFTLVLAAMLVSTMTWAQQTDKSKRPSPPETAKGTAGGAQITIDYSSPSVVSPKDVDRTGKIWGQLVPFDKYWRAGANEATIFTTDKNIMVEGKKLRKGSYSLFIKPVENGDWSVLFNSQTGQWGTVGEGDAQKPNFDPAKNVLEVSVKPEKTNKLNKRLTYEVYNEGFALIWEYMKIPVSIK